LALPRAAPQPGTATHAPAFWQVGWLAGWLAGWAGWLGWLGCCWLAGRLAGWLAS